MTVSDPLVQAERYVQNALARWPGWVSRWFGYREEKGAYEPTYVVVIWGFIGAFGGLSILFAVFGYTEYFTSRIVHPLITSFGASAILCYSDIDIPLAQPRALIFGHLFSALVGVIIATIFDLDLESNVAPKLQWLAASLSTAIALVVMHITKTTHPPAGATALLPSVSPGIRALRWYFLPVVLLSSVLIFATAVLVNNIERRYPTFWFAQIPDPEPPHRAQHRHRASNVPDTSTPHTQPRREHPLRDLEGGGR